MVGLALGEVAVHEVEVPDKRAIMKSGPVGGRAAASDQGGERCAAELIGMLPHLLYGLGAESPDRHAKAVEHALLELLPRIAREP